MGAMRKVQRGLWALMVSTSLPIPTNCYITHNVKEKDDCYDETSRKIVTFCKKDKLTKRILIF